VSNPNPQVPPRRHQITPRPIPNSTSGPSPSEPGSSPATTTPQRSWPPHARVERPTSQPHRRPVSPHHRRHRPRSTVAFNVRQPPRPTQIRHPDMPQPRQLHPQLLQHRPSRNGGTSNHPSEALKNSPPLTVSNDSPCELTTPPVPSPAAHLAPPRSGEPNTATTLPDSLQSHN